MLLTKGLIILQIVVSDVYGAVSWQEPARTNSISPSGASAEGTLDKVRILGHPFTGRCLISENKRRQGETRERKFVLWSCHDKNIKGLEQEMFSLVQSNGAGYLLMGNAGSVDNCVSAQDGYNDHVVSKICDPYDLQQSWLLRKVQGTLDAYQIVQVATGRCIRAPGTHDGAWVRVGDCDVSEKKQYWNICGLNGECNF